MVEELTIVLIAKKVNMLIGITGCIGSGKSMTLSMFNKLGYDTYDCDEFVKEAYEDKNIINELSKVFSGEGRFTKSAISNLIIKNPHLIVSLNKIIHPFVKERIMQLNHQDKLIFVEVPLLFETDFQFLFNQTIAIDCKKELRDERITKRNKNLELLTILQQQQFSNDKKKSLANYVIINDNNEENLFNQVKSCLEYLLKIK